MMSLSELRSGSIDDFLAYWLSNVALPDAEQATLEDYYRSYVNHFGPYVRRCYARQSQELMERIRATDKPRLLEVGCGCGTEALWAAMHGAQVTGVDIFPELLSVARARLQLIERELRERLPCEFRLMSVLDVDEAQPFDIIYLEQTFHHLEPRAEVVAKLSRLIAPGGHIILSEANGWNPLLQAAAFKLRGTKTIIHYMGHVWGNERITMPAIIIQHFRPYRLAPIRLQYFRVFPNAPIADKLSFIERFLPSWLKPLFTHYNLILQRR